MSDREVVLEFASTSTEREVLEDWRHGRVAREDVRAIDSRDPSLPRALEDDDDPLVTPVRVAWLPPKRAGARAARLSDLLAFRNPRRPREAEQRRILRSEPDRCQVIVGEPATVSETADSLRERRRQGELAAFVARQGALALERAERELIGTQYKVPRFVSEEIAPSAPLPQRGGASWPGGSGAPVGEVAAEAAACIEEMVASQSRLAIDAWGQFGRWLSRAYTVDVDPSRRSTGCVS